MYPKVFADYAAHHAHYGDVSRLPTPVFLNGMAQGEAMKMETVVRAERDATIAAVHAAAGMAVSPKDLLLSVAT